MTQEDREKKPWSKGGPPGPYDDIVIGSGMGGMTASAILAKAGHRVLVIEQHFEPGGFTHTFRRGPYRWDVGVHVVGEVTQEAMPGRLLDYLTDGRLRWASTGPVYDRFELPDGFKIDFPGDPKTFVATLKAAFPAENGAIDRYFERVKEVAGAMRAHYASLLAPVSIAPILERTIASAARKAMAEHTDHALAELTSDPRLRTVLAAQWGYYGSVPSRASFAMHALVVQHFKWGGYYPVGGARSIAKALLGVVAEHGGWTRVATPVRQIVLEDGRAVGVELDSGEIVRAKRVISAAGVAGTVKRLLPNLEAPWIEEIAGLSPGPAHVCLYLGLKGDPRSIGASAANQWFYETWDLEDGTWSVADKETLGDAPCLYVSFPSLKDPEHNGEHHTAEVVTFVPWSEFAKWSHTDWKHRGDQYEALKKRITARMLGQLYRRWPGMEALVDFVELSTPVTTETFARPVAGSIYGLEPTPARFAARALRPRSPIPGLFFAGCDVGSVGVIGAMMGGVLAAAAASPVSVLRGLLPIAAPRRATVQRLPISA